MLKEMEIIFNEFGIDFYLVGAFARDIHLNADAELVSKRGTDDIDFAVMIEDEGQFYQLKNALVATGNFYADKTEVIKLLYKEAIEIDLLPFGNIEKENREIWLTKPPEFVLNMPGFKEIYPSLRNIELYEGLSLKVCSLEGIILLKLIANNDRPGRTKDITDIEHIITAYFHLHAGEIYEEQFDIMDIYDTNESNYLQLVCARVMGRKMKMLLEGSEELKERLKNILELRPTTLWQAMLSGIKD